MAVVLASSPELPPALSAAGPSDVEELLKPSTDVMITDETDSSIRGKLPQELQQRNIWIKSIKIEGLVARDAIKPGEVQYYADEQLRALAVESSDQGWQLVPLGKLHDIANAIARYYRSRGYVLTQAFLPEQALVQDGTELIIIMREPVLSHISVDGEVIFTDQQLLYPFKAFIGEPVRIQGIQQAMFTLSHYPGLDINAIFQKGKQDNETAIVLKVLKSPWLSLSMSGDNFGSEVTGRNHATINASVFNPSFGLDQASLQYTHNMDPDKGGTWSVQFQRPLQHMRTLIGASATSNVFNLGAEFEGTGISGEYRQAQLFIKHFFSRTPAKTQSLSLSLIRQRSDILADDTEIKRDDLSSVTLAAEMGQLWPIYNAQSHMQLSYTRGIPGFLGSMDTYIENGVNVPPSQGGSGKYAQGTYDRTNIAVTVVKALPFDSMLMWRLVGQYSDMFLTSLERYGLGGSSILRAYDADYMVDSSIVTAFDLRIPILPQAWSKNISGQVHALAFLDYGIGWVHDPDTFERDNTVDGIKLYNYGFGISTNITDAFSMKLQVGLPFSDAPEPQDKKNIKYWLNFTLHVI